MTELPHGGSRDGHPVVLVIAGAITREDIPELCARGQMLVERADADLLICEVGDVEPDIWAIEVLARLRLVAARQGCGIAVAHASCKLRDLIDLVGLHRYLPC